MPVGKMTFNLNNLNGWNLGCQAKDPPIICFIQVHFLSVPMAEWIPKMNHQIQYILKANLWASEANTSLLLAKLASIDLNYYL